MQVLGLCGVARSGKDSFADFLIKLFPLKFSKASFAFYLKKDLDPFLLEKLNISAFTEDTTEKEIIRPLLIAWGTDVIRNNYDRKHWIKKINKKVVENSKNNLITIIPDVRFDNELEWIGVRGKNIFINNPACEPKGDLELDTLKLKNSVDFYFEWNKMDDFENEGLMKVKNFYNSLCI